MAITLYNLKKWYLMLSGKSILHVNQNMGKLFVIDKLEGYFNNMTEKVIREPSLLENDDLPLLKTEDGNIIYFPVAIFQYGLGAYDLYISTKEEKYLKKFTSCTDWAIANQESTGAWSNFSFIYPDHPYGAMCQGEGASLLLRAYKEFGDYKFFESAKKAVDFMLLPVIAGGTTEYNNEEVFLLEYTHKAIVLNGWIFALFGLYDLTLVEKSDKYTQVLQGSINSLKKYLSQFDNGYWSLYDLDNKITSPFYHNLHIAQLEAMYIITKDELFNEYLQKWESYNKCWWKRKVAFLKKAIQKIVEK